MLQVSASLVSSGELLFDLDGKVVKGRITNRTESVEVVDTVTNSSLYLGLGIGLGSGLLLILSLAVAMGVAGYFYRRCVTMSLCVSNYNWKNGSHCGVSELIPKLQSQSKLPIQSKPNSILFFALLSSSVSRVW